MESLGHRIIIIITSLHRPTFPHKRTTYLFVCILQHIVSCSYHPCVNSCLLWVTEISLKLSNKGSADEIVYRSFQPSFILLFQIFKLDHIVFRTRSRFNWSGSDFWTNFDRSFSSGRCHAKTVTCST